LGALPFEFLEREISVNIFEMKNTELVKEFDRYVREHPAFADDIPKNAVVVMQLEGDRKFNQWSRKLAQTHAEEGQPIVYVQIKKLKPLRSRIEKLELKRVA
jgi:hypothetical protein